MPTKEIEKKCRDKEFYTYGTIRIFEKRANKLKLMRTWITFLGIITPVVIGGVVLSFGTDVDVLPYFLIVAGVIGTVQLILSTWSIVNRWDEAYEYAIESARVNTNLYNKFKYLADNCPEDIELQFENYREKYEQREFLDIGKGITDKEKRFANREALRYFGKACHLCKEIPKTIKPTKASKNCDSCGNL